MTAQLLKIDREPAIDREPSIEIAALRKVYPGGVEAVKGFDLKVAPGEVFSLLGPDGAGKSTTIGMLTSTVAPTSGTARLGGFDVSTLALAARRISSVLFQEAVIDRPLTGRRHLELHARLWGVPRQDATRRLETVIDALDLSELAGECCGWACPSGRAS